MGVDIRRDDDDGVGRLARALLDHEPEGATARPQVGR